MTASTDEKKPAQEFQHHHETDCWATPKRPHELSSYSCQPKWKLWSER